MTPFDAFVEELAIAAAARLYSATKDEGMTTKEALIEIIGIILTTHEETRSFLLATKEKGRKTS